VNYRAGESQENQEEAIILLPQVLFFLLGQVHVTLTTEKILSHDFTD
jgi:hypothetical protein